MQPSRTSSLIFAAKASLLRARRSLTDTVAHLTRHSAGRLTDFSEILAESVTPLWTDMLLAEVTLQLGKVQNLRCATRELHRIVVPAGETFSFWKQLGRTSMRKGYVAGRMLQEGCIIPSIGGGLCQLSNALYDVCLTAGCEIVERHAHSQVIPGSAAALGRDATVAWNYVDFRFRAPIPLLIEVFLRREELVVRLRAAGKSEQMAASARSGLTLQAGPARHDAQSCETCGVHSCFRHAAFFAGPRAETKSAFLFDECWPEFRRYAQAKQQPGDLFGHPIDGARWRLPRYDCPSSGFAKTSTAAVQTIWRSFQSRRQAHDVPRRVAAQMAGSNAVAARLSKLLSKEVTTVYVEQSFLPFLWQNMDLGGRTVKVLMTRLPLTELHRRLDDAFRRHPERRTLNELRADAETVEAEGEALDYATSIVTPHAEIARLFAGKCEKLPWEMPAAVQRSAVAPSANSIAFPGPTVARKGAYEVRAAARALDLEVLLLGSELEGSDFWERVRTRHIAPDALAQASAVVQPALIEDKPRMLLKAIAAGIPVILTEACGIDPVAGVQLIPTGDESALAQALTVSAR